MSGVLKEHRVLPGGSWLRIIFTHEYQGKGKNLMLGNEPKSELESIRKTSELLRGE